MKLLKTLLREATKKKTEINPNAQTDVADKPSINFDFDLNGPKSSGELAKPTPRVEPKQHAQGKRRTASAADTWKKMGNISLDQDKLNQAQLMDINPDEIDMSDEISDEEAARTAGADFNLLQQMGHAAPEVKTPENLPAVISKAMTKSGTSLANIEPDWHMVKNLPGYLSAPIRAMGRSVFAPFTKTKIEDIQVLADIGGGPNTEAELNAITRYVSKHGKRDNAAEIEFQKVIPGYQADVVIYTCDGYTFFLVKDFAGNYIYSWPEADNKELFTAVDKKLGRDRKIPRLN